MALQGHPLDLDNPDAYHKIALLTRVDDVQFAEFAVYENVDARWRGDKPVQILTLESVLPAGTDRSDENAVKTAVYVDAKTRPLWADALDV